MGVIGHFLQSPPLFRPCDGLNQSDVLSSGPSPESTGTIPGVRAYRASNGGISMSNNLSEAIDRIVADCNGDLRGAVRALLLVNEQLEAELTQLYVAAGALSESGDRILH